MSTFEKVCPKDYSKLFSMLEKRLPKSTMAHNVIQMKTLDIHPPSTETEVYSFNGMYTGENAFIVILMHRKITKDTSIIVSTPTKVTDDMNSGLEQLIKWNGTLFFCAVDTDYSPVIIDMCKRFGNMRRVSRCDFLYVPLNDAKAIKDEDLKSNAGNVKISELTPNDAKFVTDNWKFASNGSEEIMKEQIRCIGSAGVYLDSDLVSCVSIFSMGSINALFTSETVRGKGYGYLTMKKVCQVAGEKGLVPNVQVEIWNEPSKKLMGKVGFIQSHQIEWVWYSPKE